MPHNFQIETLNFSLQIISKSLVITEASAKSNRNCKLSITSNIKKNLSTKKISYSPYIRLVLINVITIRTSEHMQILKSELQTHSPQKLLNPCQQRGHYTAKIYVSTCRDKLRHESAVIYLPKHYEKTCAPLHHHWNWFNVVVLQRCIVISGAACRANELSVCSTLPAPDHNSASGGCFRNWING